jgi:hypothetical protein
MVKALKIECVTHCEPDGLKLDFFDRRYDTLCLSKSEMNHKPIPESGWYLVVYEDDYFSFSPEKVFEDGYTQLSEGGL